MDYFRCTNVHIGFIHVVINFLSAFHLDLMTVNDYEQTFIIILFVLFVILLFVIHYLVVHSLSDSRAARLLTWASISIQHWGNH